MQDSIVRPQRRRAHRASTYFLIGVLLVCALGGWYLWYRGLAVRTVYVAARDLPTYHQITAADVQKSNVRSDQVPSQATAHMSDLVGGYTLVPVQRGRALSLNELGPKLPVGTLAKQLVVGLPASVSDIGGGAVARGDRVDILLSSTAANHARNGVLRGAVVLDVKPIGKQPSQFVIVCAFPASDEKILLAAGGTARIFVARVFPTGPS